MHNLTISQLRGGVGQLFVSQFTEEETGSEWSSDLSEVPEQVNEKGKTETQEHFS